MQHSNICKTTIDPDPGFQRRTSSRHSSINHFSLGPRSWGHIKPLLSPDSHFLSYWTCESRISVIFAETLIWNALELARKRKLLSSLLPLRPGCPLFISSSQFTTFAASPSSLCSDSCSKNSTSVTLLMLATTTTSKACWSNQQRRSQPCLLAAAAGTPRILFSAAAAAEATLADHHRKVRCCCRCC